MKVKKVTIVFTNGKLADLTSMSESGMEKLKQWFEDDSSGNIFVLNGKKDDSYLAIQKSSISTIEIKEIDFIEW